MKILSRLNLFLRPFSSRILLAILAGTATIGSSVLLLGTSAFLISKAALQPSVAELQVAIVGVRFFGICRGIFRYLERLLTHSVNLRILSNMRTWFFRQVEPLVPAGLVHIQRGDLLSRAVHDIETLENYFIRVVSPPMVFVLVVAGSALYIASFNDVLALIYLAGSLLAGIALTGIAYLAGRSVSKESQLQHASLNAQLVDYHHGYMDLVMAGRDQERLSSLQNAGHELVAANARLARVNAGVNAAHIGLSNLTMAAVLVYGAWLSSQGQLDALYLGAIALVTVASFEATQTLMTGSAYLNRSIEAGARLFALADQKPPIREQLEAQPLSDQFEEIVLDDLSFAYDDHSAVLENLSTRINAGERIAILGPSGTGKTTLAQMLVRFLDPTTGTITWDGSDIRTCTTSELRAKVSLLTQQGYIFAGSVRDNLLLAVPEANDAALEDVLTSVGLQTWLKQLADGLASELGENGLGMSAGERQRLNLARTLLRNSPVLIMDEPVANLDQLTANEIRQRVLNEPRGQTILWITHSLAGLDDFDRILVLRDGQIIEDGSAAVLLEKGGYYAGLIDLRRSLIQ